MSRKMLQVQRSSWMAKTTSVFYTDRVSPLESSKQCLHVSDLPFVKRIRLGEMPSTRLSARCIHTKIFSKKSNLVCVTRWSICFNVVPHRVYVFLLSAEPLFSVRSPTIKHSKGPPPLRHIVRVRIWSFLLICRFHCSSSQMRRCRRCLLVPSIHNLEIGNNERLRRSPNKIEPFGSSMQEVFVNDTWWSATAHIALVNVLNFKTDKPRTKRHVFIGILVQYGPTNCNLDLSYVLMHLYIVIKTLVNKMESLT